ncbi:MAG: PAS domain S-box protein [Deltaproteobacteria bacterium]|nr:PAS domain S-box protein [Deltaproteobacteria bacterium]
MSEAQAGSVQAPHEPIARLERELTAARNALRGLVDALPSPAVIVDRDHVIVLGNEALARALGRERSDVIGQRVEQVLPPALAAARLAHIDEVLASGRPRQFDDEDAEGRSYRNHLYPIVGEGGAVERVAVFAVDVSDVRRAASELRASEERLRATIERTPEVAVQWYDATGRVRLWNRASERMFGFAAAEALGRTLDQLIHTPEEAAQFVETLADIARTGQAVGPVELTFRRRDGSSGHCLSTIFGIPGEADEPRFVCMDVDLTERKRVESQLRQSQKEEVLGRLAGGIAHDFNNLLTAVVGFAELGLSDEADASECFEHILEAARRGAQLTGNLLAFARKKVVAPRAVRLRDVVERLVPLMRPLIGEHIELVSHHEITPERVFIDVGGLEQVLMNLVVNARDAMPDGGRLTIETRVAARAGADEPRQLLLRVQDTGVGVPPEHQPRVFEPFFTTKPTGQGTGLGLAMCAGIVRQAGGTIALESQPGRGTGVTVLLPIAEDTGARAVVDAR